MQQVQQLDTELKTNEIRLDLARILPHLLEDEPEKKTTKDRQKRRRMLKKKRKQRRGKPR